MTGFVLQGHIFKKIQYFEPVNWAEVLWKQIQI